MTDEESPAGRSAAIVNEDYPIALYRDGRIRKLDLGPDMPGHFVFWFWHDERVLISQDVGARESNEFTYALRFESRDAWEMLVRAAEETGRGKFDEESGAALIIPAIEEALGTSAHTPLIPSWSPPREPVKRPHDEHPWDAVAVATALVAVEDGTVRAALESRVGDRAAVDFLIAALEVGVEGAPVAAFDPGIESGSSAGAEADHPDEPAAAAQSDFPERDAPPGHAEIGAAVIGYPADKPVHFEDFGQTCGGATGPVTGNPALVTCPQCLDAVRLADAFADNVRAALAPEQLAEANRANRERAERGAAATAGAASRDKVWAAVPDTIHDFVRALGDRWALPLRASSTTSSSCPRRSTRSSAAGGTSARRTSSPRSVSSATPTPRARGSSPRGTPSSAGRARAIMGSCPARPGRGSEMVASRDYYNEGDVVRRPINRLGRVLKVRTKTLMVMEVRYTGSGDAQIEVGLQQWKKNDCRLASQSDLERLKAGARHARTYFGEGMDHPLPGESVGGK